MSGLQRLGQLLNERAGLRLDAGNLELVERRLNSRLDQSGCADLVDYHRLVSSATPEGKRELGLALELVTTGETYFFRHEEQLALLSQEIFPALARQNSGTRRLRIWSAGCSTGEEAYTLAILALESGLFAGWDVLVQGTDIASGRVEHARRGSYEGGAFRTTNAARKERWFEPRDKAWVVSADLKKVCTFQALNLINPLAMALVGRVDLAVCRNVLIYLDERARRVVLQNLYERLVPGGYLLLGHSESTRSDSPALELIALSQELAYLKPATARQRRGA